MLGPLIKKHRQSDPKRNVSKRLRQRKSGVPPDKYGGPSRCNHDLSILRSGHPIRSPHRHRNLYFYFEEPHFH